MEINDMLRVRIENKINGIPLGLNIVDVCKRGIVDQGEILKFTLNADKIVNKGLTEKRKASKKVVAKQLAEIYLALTIIAENYQIDLDETVINQFDEITKHLIL